MSALDRLDAERRGEMRLAGADGPEQDDVARFDDPRAPTELLDACALEPVRSFPVELCERLLRWQSGGVEAALDGTLEEVFLKLTEEEIPVPA